MSLSEETRRAIVARHIPYATSTHKETAEVFGLTPYEIVEILRDYNLELEEMKKEPVLL